MSLFPHAFPQTRPFRETRLFRLLASPLPGTGLGMRGVALRDGLPGPE